MKRTQIYLSNEQREGIDQIIKENGCGTMVEIIRRAIDEYLEKVRSNKPVRYSNLINFNLSFKDSQDKITYCGIDRFHCTGCPPPLEEALKMDRGGLGTIGYFRDNEGFLRDASQIVNFMGGKDGK